METAPPTALPETLPISGDANAYISQEVRSSLAEDFRTSNSPFLASHAQNDNEVRVLRHDLQTAAKETNLSNSETHQIQPQTGAGLEVVTAAHECNPENGTSLEFQSYAGGTIVPQAQVQICFTASPFPDAGEHGASEQSEQASTTQDSEAPVPASWNCSEQVHLPQVISQLVQGAVDMSEHVNEADDTSDKAAPLTTKTLETLNTGELPTGPGSGSPAPALFHGTAPGEDADIQTGCLREEQSERSSKGSALCPALDSDFVVSLQAEQEEAEPSQPCQQIPLTETPVIAELVHSAESQEIVVVSEASWSNMHLKQSYLLQHADGSVCEAAIVTGHAPAEAKLYEDGVQADLDLESQNVEVYQFCGLVEEVAEETVCVSTSVQIPHSPGYEVNLFNALLDSSEGLESHLEPSIHTIDDSDTVIISQQALPASHDAGQAQVCSNNNVHNLSVAAAMGQHLLLDASSNQVCLVEVDSFPIQQTDTPTRVMMPCSHVSEDRQEAEGQPAPPLPVDTAKGKRTEPCVTPEARISSPAGTQEPPSEDPSQHAQPEAFITHPARILGPKLLLLQPGSSSLLKHPPSRLAQVTQGNVDPNPDDAASDECLAVASSPAAESNHAHGTKPSVSEAAAASPCVTSSAGQPEALPVTSTSSPIPTSHTSGDSLAAQHEQSSGVPPSFSANDPTMQPDSPFAEEEEEEDEDEEEDEEDDEAPGDAEAMDDASGQVSSADEGSDDDADREEGEMTTPCSSHKVRKWIADRVSPSTSSSSFLEPSPSSDWTTSRHEKSSPLRGPHGKFVSPSSLGGYSSSSSPPDHSTPQRPRGERRGDMVELAKHEADIEHRTQALKREGCWSTKRLTRLMEPPRPKVHWDYLCEEMQWLSADFAQERRWKRGVARKVVRMVMRHHEELRQKEEKAKRDEHAKIRRVASSIAKEVRAFWSSVEKVVQYKQQSRLEEKRKKALDLQLDFIVGQTEKYSDLLSKSLAPTSRPEAVPSPSKTSAPSAIDEDDRDFEPPCEEDDDEETIEVEEQQDGNDAESHRREIELLKEESMLPLDQLLSTLQQPQNSASDEECSDDSSSARQEEEDGEFTANEEDAEDEEDTIAAQEKVEGDVDHAEELDDLAKEGDMTMEELLEKYKGAYTSDFEEPSASGSKASSDSEVYGDEEVETEDDESNVECNTSSSDSTGESEEEEEEEEEDSEKDEESEEEEDDCADEGMELLLKEGDHSPSSSSSRPKKEISHIAATAESLQPKGYTLATTKVKTPIPFLLHGTLREYQHIGLDWLVTMFEKKLNGILADEMGLGKTIQTIALLAHLACEKGNWGPHLIIVPTSVMLNWEMELKRWCPGFKILTYFGSQKERKLKRQGWTKPNAFHVCITSYKLVLQDHQAFRRKSWRYLILDEAQNIKNFKSQRWQSLLNFNSHRRLLLTGTPLQNSLMELWSLMHFLMPHVFQSHREFKEWFSNPLTGMIEGSQEYNEGLVKRLHKVLRPFLLRRIKADVEKQMPKKYEHVVRCRLSKRQRFLYDDFMAQASTKETLASGHFMSVINILMQLRKVCNHPNLFDPRPIQSPFITKPIVFRTASLVLDAMEVPPLKRCDLSIFDLIGLEGRVTRYQADIFASNHKVGRQLIQEIVESPAPAPRLKQIRMKVNRFFHPPPKGDNRSAVPTNKPTSVPPAAQTHKPPTPEASAPPLSAPPPAAVPAPAPAVQQVICSVATTPPPRSSLPPGAQTAVRSSAPKPVLTVRPPPAPCTASIPAHPSPNTSSIMPQRVLLSPDMQARLPSGEVVSIAQLASLAGRPVSSCQGSKPVTFQLQGNKLTLSGAPIHQVQAPSPRPIQGNVMHLVSSGGQHHLISQSAQVSVQSPASVKPAPATNPAHRLPLSPSSQVPSSSVVSSPGVVKIVVRQAPGKEGGPVPTLAVAPSPRVTSPHPYPNTAPIRIAAMQQVAQRTPGPATATYTLAPPRTSSTTPNQSQPLPPILKIVQPPPPCTEKPAASSAPAEATSSSASKPAAHDGTSTNTNTSATNTTTTTAAPTSNTSQTPVGTKAKASAAAKVHPLPRKAPRPPPCSPFYIPSLAHALRQQRNDKLDFIFSVNERRCAATPVYGKEVLDFLTFLPGARPSPASLCPAEAEWGRSGHSSCLQSQQGHECDFWSHSHYVGHAIHSIEERLELLTDIVDRFTFVIPPVEAACITMHCCHPPPSLGHKEAMFSSALSEQVTPLTRSLHRIQCNMRTQFPDLRLIQYDCGKLQTLHLLLRNLKTGGHRVLIFTQMTRMLDVLEQFLNYHGHIYLRLDGSTRVEQRQALMERFNADRRIFCFILSTRSGGVGVNLTGADTVVFYDSDWNPTMDAQAQDRCHRIGQTRDVHIYRLISERTVEENILKKANQKRMLGDMAIEGGNFTTAFFKQQTIRELFDVNDGEKREVAVEVSVPHAEDEEAGNKQSTTILEQALCRAEDEEDIVAASQAKAEQVAELAEFNENIPLDDGGEQEDVEELSKAEQEIAALVEQLTPIERYAMNFLEASLEDVCKEELKQAEEQVEAARKGLDQAKEEGLRLHASSDEDEFLSTPASVEQAQPAPARRGRKPKDKDKVKTVTSTRTSGRLRGASPETEPAMYREVPERVRAGLRGRSSAKDSNTPSRTDPSKTLTARLQDSSKSSKASSPARDHQASKNKPQASSVPSSPQSVSETPRRGKEENLKESRLSETSLEPVRQVEHEAKDDVGKDQSAMSPPSTSCRSPRKRQSADDEVLRGLVDDSPSAKVLRKLPGRLVTVVEEKEPRKRRWRGSSTGGSSEEASLEENTSGPVEEPNKDTPSSVPDSSSSKDTLTKSPQDQDSTQSPPVHLQPVRAYPPYSPPHLSPDMPVLRNLPVRRRLETESRMAAQLGELLHAGRGRGTYKKTDSSPSKETTSPEAGVNSHATPLKRKRGRPPKCPPKLPDLNNMASPPPSQPVSPCEDGGAPLSPKRKRGRPRKDSVSSPDFVCDGQKNVPPTAIVSSGSRLDASEDLSVPLDQKSEDTDQEFLSTKAEEMDSKTEESAPPITRQTPAQAPTEPEAQQASIASPDSVTKPDPAAEPTPNQVSTPSQSPPASPVLSPPPAFDLSGPSDAPSEPDPSDAAKTAACAPPVATTPPPPKPPAMMVEAAPTSEPDASVPSSQVEAGPAAEKESLQSSVPPANTTDTPTFTHPVATSSSPMEGSSQQTEPNCTSPPNTEPVCPEQSNTSQPAASAVDACPPVEAPTSPLSNMPTPTSAPPSPPFPPPPAETHRSDAATTSLAASTTSCAPCDENTSSTSPDKMDATPHRPTPSTDRTTTTAPPESVPPSAISTAATTTLAPQTSSVISSQSQTYAAASKTTPPPSTEPDPVWSKRERDQTALTEADNVEAEDNTQQDILVSQSKRRKVASSPEAKDAEKEGEVVEGDKGNSPQEEEVAPEEVKRTSEEHKTPTQKRSFSRQSSQDSTRSSSPSSGCSTSTLTRHAHHKRTYENRHPSKRQRVDVTSEAGPGDKEEEETSPQRRRTRSFSSSCDSEDEGGRKEHRLTCSAKCQPQDQNQDQSRKREGRKPARGSDSNANTSTGGDSGSDSSSVRVTRRSVGSSQDKKLPPSSAASRPPEPEVLGKRCSALNAAAKLLAMKGRVDTPGHTPRKDSKAGGKGPAASPDQKNQKSKSKTVLVPPQSNSGNVANSKSGSKPTSNQASRPASRSTRQCPGSLVPPLEEYKRPKPEEKEGGSRKAAKGKEGGGEASRGPSACSSMSSDGEADGGRPPSSRSRSSSASSRRAHSASSQNTERKGARSRAASSGSDRSAERVRKDKQARRRGSQGERRSLKLSQDTTASLGAEGTPDRVLRSVAALAAVQARSPAASTRSSANQQRHNKT
ncbi:helicase SRCAP isoform X2 [Dunckerocampus dactyliophorus]|uniref:helicase SRCAP isoform X2 n=1 Tax=Dunckerocampus dactyliophorus TaxID=161453 RepID=UPI0024054B08|nr:helicase SRCAP isoform X2 [Dunckerocampus dactyliophorus]